MEINISGPTDYCLFSETDFYYGKSFPFATTPRFMKIDDGTPGPGDYTVSTGQHPYIDDEKGASRHFTSVLHNTLL